MCTSMRTRVSLCSGRQHEPHWVMIMYYPQETTADMGPTQLLPGSQYYRGDSDRQHYAGHIPDFSEQLDAWATVVDTVVGPAVQCSDAL